MAKPNIYDLEFSKRLEAVMAKSGQNANSLAVQMGVSAPTVARWIRGEADPTRSNLIKLAEATGVSLQWLATGEGESQGQAQTQPEAQDDTQTQYIDDYRHIHVSAGFGAFNEEQNPTQAPIETSWLQKRQLKARHCAIFTVDGDSMHPTLKDGEEIIIDRTKQALREGKIFVLNHKGRMWVKRVKINYDSIDLLSDNPHYTPITLTDQEANQLNVIGQVVRAYRDY